MNPVTSGLFTSPQAPLLNVQHWNDRYSLGFTERDFSNLEDAPLLTVTNDLVAVVLVPYLRTESATFEVLWQIASAQQPKKWRADSILSDEDHLRCLPGSTHPGHCLRWEIINFAANWDKEKEVQPREVRKPGISPHAGILAAAAHFPRWVWAMDGENVPYAYLPGWQLTISGFEQWAHLPSLMYDYRGYIKLGAMQDNDRARCYAVPEFVQAA